MASVNPYLNFSGNAEEAFEFYRSVFGTAYLGIIRFKDAPPDMTCPEESLDKIMHIALPIGNGTLLMGSDRPKSLGQATSGDSYYLSINADTATEAVRLFNGLSVGGHITMPLEKAFWGSLFGMFTDKFGIQWMINYESNQL